MAKLVSKFSHDFWTNGGIFWTILEKNEFFMDCCSKTISFMENRPMMYIRTHFQLYTMVVNLLGKEFDNWLNNFVKVEYSLV